MVGFFSKIRNLLSILTHSRVTLILGMLILLAAVPLTVIISQQQQETRQRASGPEDNAPDAAKNLSQNLSQSNNPKGCGDKCAEEPPVPSGVLTINYCSQPLTVPSSEVSDTYKSYQNVKNNKDGKDNRYFVYVAKDNTDPVKIKVGNVNDTVIEQLVGDPVSFDGNNLTVVSSGAFAIHANQSKESAVGPCILGAFCSYKSLSLKAEKTKYRIYPSDNCAQLSASISYMAAKKSLDGDGGTGKGLLYAAMNKVVDKVFEAQVHVVEKAKTVSSLVSSATPTTEKVTVRIDMQMGGEKIPLIEGMTYAGATFTKGEAVQPALEFARGLRNLPTPEEKIVAINRWVAENGVYPTEEVVQQLIKDEKFDLAEFASRFFKQSANSSASQFSHAEETLDNLMSTKLPDGRFMCVCRDASVLGAAMAQEAGVQAWPVEGFMVDKPVVSPQDLQSLSETDVSEKGHAWVEFEGSQGKIVGWDPTYALSTDLTTPPKIYNHEFTSAKFPNDFKYSRILSIPDVLVDNGDILSLSIVDSEGRVIPHRILNFRGAFGLYIEGYRGEEKLTYKIELKLKDSNKIITVNLESSAGTDIALSSSKFSAVTDSKVPIIVNMGRELTSFNQDLLSKETIDGIKTYNKARSEFIRNHPNTPAELSVMQEEELTFLRMLLVHNSNFSKEEAAFIIKDAITTVEQRMTALSPEQKVSVIADTLATAENSPLKGKGMMSLESLKAHPSKFFAKGVGVGTNMANLLGGPITAELADSLDNAYLITAVRTVNTVGTGQMVLAGGKTLASAAIAANAAFKGASGALAAKSVAGGVAAGAALGGAAASLAVQTAIVSVGTAMGTTLYCGVNPKSALCGCRISGEYGDNQIKLELQRYDVSPGEKINYRVLGYENCPSHVGLETAFGMTNLANVQMPMSLKIGESPSILKQLGMGQSDMDKRKKEECKWQADGRWCLGKFAVPLDLKSGNYKIILNRPSLVSSDYNSVNVEEYDPNQVLTVKGSEVFVKLPSGLTPTPKLTPSSSPTLTIAPTPNAQSIYTQCLKICDQGSFASESFDKPACIKQCDSKYKQSSSVIIISTPTPVSLPSSGTTNKKGIAKINDTCTSNIQCASGACGNWIISQEGEPLYGVCVETFSNFIVPPTPTPIPTVVPLSPSQCFEKCVDEIADVNACQRSCGISSPTPTPTPLVVVSSPTSIPTATQTPVDLHSLGDANGDGKINEEDKSIWLNEITGILATKKSDFYPDGIINTDDYNILRDSMNNPNLPH